MIIKNICVELCKTYSYFWKTPKVQEADNSVDADTVNDATAFLETFFKLYSTATNKELAYDVEEMPLKR